MNVGRLARVQASVSVDNVLDHQRRHRVTVLHGVLAAVNQLLIVLGPVYQPRHQLDITSDAHAKLPSTIVSFNKPLYSNAVVTCERGRLRQPSRL